MPYYAPSQLQNTQLHFIIGPHRSGTTLLTSILNTHPQLLSTPEFRFVLHFMNPYGKQKPVSPVFARDFNKYISQIFKQEKSKNIWSLMSFNKDIYGNMDGNEMRNYEYDSLYKLLLMNVELPNKDYTGITTIIDKNPHYSFYTPQLLQQFPDAKFLVAMRDYRAIYLSKRDSRRTKESVLFHAVRINEFLTHTWQTCQTLPTKTHIVPYEQVVLQPENTIKNICQFLQVPFLPQMLSPQERLSTITTATTEQLAPRDQKILTELAKPINTSRLEVWKDQLSDNELRILETICGDIGRKFGYEPILSLNDQEKKQILDKNKWAIAKEKMLFSLSVSNYYKFPYWLRQCFKPKA
jgi:hypothetical protein